MTQAIRARILLTFTAVLAAGTWSGPLAADEKIKTEVLVLEAREIAKSFAGELMTTLQTAIKDGGTAGGIAACHISAPAIAAEAAKRSGWSVGRTSLEVRNPANAPDTFERTALEDFQAAVQAGADLAKLEREEIVTRDGKTTFRFVKAISVAEPCLACHGSSVTPDTAKAIRDLYPADQAVGYNLGDLRGAFTLTRVLE
jgi:hypothetical protein